MRIVITVEGGLVQNVYTDSGDTVEYRVLDADTEGADRDEIVETKHAFPDNVIETLEWTLNGDAAAADPDFVEQVFSL